MCFSLSFPPVNVKRVTFSAGWRVRVTLFVRRGRHLLYWPEFSKHTTVRARHGATAAAAAAAAVAATENENGQEL